MGQAQFESSVTLTQFSCGGCGGVYALNERYREHAYRNAGTWHCPYCGISWGYSETEVDRLKKELAAESARKLNALSEANVARVERDKAMRKLKRVSHGVCPECKRTFSDLARHMLCKHAEKKAA